MLQETTNKSNEELMTLYKNTKKPELKQELTLRYVYLLKIIARQMRGVWSSFSDVDDIVNEGIITLMEAIDNFDSSKNVKFETYASLRIRGTIIDLARKQDWVPRSVRKSIKDIEQAISQLHDKFERYPTDEEIAAYLGISTEKYLKLLGEGSLANILSLNALISDSLPESQMNPIVTNEYTKSPESLMQKKEMVSVIKESIENLKENEKMVISLYYNEELSIKEIAKILSLTESRISQIHSKALLKLKHYLEKYVKT